MQNQQEWASLSEEDRNRMTEIYQNNEREVRGKADLAIETVSARSLSLSLSVTRLQLNMLNYLTSDENIRLPFLFDEILPR